MILTEPSELTQLKQTIRAKANNPDLFVFSAHAIERGNERSITLIDVVRVAARVRSASLSPLTASQVNIGFRSLIWSPDGKLLFRPPDGSTRQETFSS